MRSFLFFLAICLLYVVPASAQSNLNTQGSFRCNGRTILQVRRGVARPISLSAFNKLQKTAISNLTQRLRRARQNQRAAIQAQIAEARALRSAGQQCARGQFVPPTPTPGPLNIVRPLAVGFSHVCAITPSPEGNVFCWGKNDLGQVGTAPFSNAVSAPVRVAGVSRAIAVAAGRVHSCAVLESGQVRCWGANFNGQTSGDGNFSNTPSSSPTTIVGVSDAADIVSTNSNICIRTTEGGVRCWGQNGNGESGVSPLSSIRPVSTPAGLSSSVQTIGSGQNHTCVSNSNGVQFCFGWNADAQQGFLGVTNVISPTQTPGLGSPVNGSSGGNLFGCSLVSGVVFCSGRNNLGQLGIANSTTSTTSYQQSTGVPSAVAQISSGRDHSIARLNSGAVVSFGANDKGQLGGGQTGGNVSSLTGAVSVLNLSPAVTFVAAGGDQACAILQGGSVRCWGDNAFGQIGNGGVNSSGEPTPVTVTGFIAAQ